jgi:FkbM family methyltransferase
MTAENPLIAAFDVLAALRGSLAKYRQSNAADPAGMFVNFCAANFMNSQAQLFQDLLVVFLLKGKRNGFFVEFGATNGRDLSNTFTLEHNLQWKGILAEPAKCWHAALRSNRKAAIDTRCVWSESGQQLAFTETELAELSTLNEFVDKDFNKAGRATGTSYPVETVSLTDLLKAHKSPKEIDYMSIDTEGSELPILQAFNFDQYDIKIITVEHNFVEPTRANIHALLTSKGFVRLFDMLSKFDDWYVKKSIVGL